MAVSAGCWNVSQEEWAPLDLPWVNDNTRPPVSGRLPFSAVLLGETTQETIPAPGSFAKFKGSVFAGNPSPSESTSNSQHEKQYACDCIQSLILRNVLGSSWTPWVWDGTTDHQPRFVPSTPCRNIPNSLWLCKHVTFTGCPTGMKEQKESRYRWHIIPVEVKIVFYIITG